MFAYARVPIYVVHSRQHIHLRSGTTPHTKDNTYPLRKSVTLDITRAPRIQLQYYVCYINTVANNSLVLENSSSLTISSNTQDQSGTGI